MPSLTNFIPGSLRILRHVRDAKRFAHKFNVVCIAFFFCSDYIRRYLPFVEKRFHELSSILAKRTVINIDGVRFTLVDGRSLSVVLPEFETWMWQYLKVKKGDVFLDVGAHIGKYACQVAKKIEAALVIAIEPDPKNYGVLLRNIRENGIENVVVFDIAAWNENCKMKFFIHEWAGQHSLKEKSSWKPDTTIIVQAKKLDDVLEALGVKVDWVKIDVEGAELETLQGLERTLKKDHPNIVVETRGSNVEPLKRFMKKLRYNVGSIPAGRDPMLNVWHFYCVRK